MTSVSLQGVSKVYADGTQAVQDLFLEVGDGELLVLIGPSGSGKTTTLRMIAGLEEVSSGEVRLAGEIVNDVPPHRRDVAMVFQEDALQPHLSVRSNLSFGLKVRRPWRRRGGNARESLFIKEDAKQNLSTSGDMPPHSKPKGDIDQRINEAARLLGIEELLDQRPWQLSGGQRQRVALGRAMVRSPAVLLLDEPLAHLDGALRNQMRWELRRLQARLAITMVYVTHDWLEAMSLGDRIAVLDAGKLQQVGPPLEVYDRPKTQAVARMLGNPPMNFIGGRLVGDGGGMRFVGGGWDVALVAAQVARLAGQAGRKVVWGVRPEHVCVTAAGEPRAAACNLAKISMVETLGDSTILRLRPERLPDHASTDAGECGLTCRQAGRPPWRTEDAVAVQLDAEKCHVFDPQTQQNLTMNDAHAAAELIAAEVVGLEDWSHPTA